MSVPFSTEIETVVGSTAGANRCFLCFGLVGALGSWFVGEGTSCGWVNAKTAWWIASGVASTTDAAPIIPVVACRREAMMCLLE